MLIIQYLSIRIQAIRILRYIKSKYIKSRLYELKLHKFYSNIKTNEERFYFIISEKYSSDTLSYMNNFCFQLLVY